VLDISNLEQDLDTAYFLEDNKVLFATPYNITSANSIRNKQSFVLDSGSTRYIISSKSLFNTFSNYTSSIIWGDNSTIYSKGIGNVVINIANDKQLLLKDCLYIPTFS
jgi:hypothetical protein